MLDRRVPGLLRRPSNRLTVGAPRSPGRINPPRLLVPGPLGKPGRFQPMPILPAPQAPGSIQRRFPISTNAEAVTGTNAVKAVSPAGLTARIAAPGPIGGTTPDVATFNRFDLPEISTPADPAANVARVYCRDDGGTTKVYFRDSAGVETFMGGGGGLTPGLFTLAAGTVSSAATLDLVLTSYTAYRGHQDRLDRLGARYGCCRLMVSPLDRRWIELRCGSR
jgi:hypothetical protein